METDRAPLKDESLHTGLTGLIQLGQKAYAEKRRKDCMALIGAILKIDPENSGALRLLAFIQSDIDQALQQVDQLSHDPQWNQDVALQKNAVRLLLSVLEIDPQHGSASALLFKISPASHANRSSGKRETLRVREIEKVTYPIEVRDSANMIGAPTPWVHRAYLLIAILLIGGTAIILFS
jgi:hypothetical protein